MSITVEGRLLENRFTTAQWAASTVVLKDRVWGHEIDGSGNPIGSKMGNGVDLWAALPYWYGGTSVIPDVHPIVAGETNTPLTIPFTSSTPPRYVAVKTSDGSYDWTLFVQWTGTGFTISQPDDGAGHFVDGYSFVINP